MLVNATTGQTAFEDKEQIWADKCILEPLEVCPATFGDTDIWSATNG